MHNNPVSTACLRFIRHGRFVVPHSDQSLYYRVEYAGNSIHHYMEPVSAGASGAAMMKNFPKKIQLYHYIGGGTVDHLYGLNGAFSCIPAIA
jgi:hypothetical protein